MNTPQPESELCLLAARESLSPQWQQNIWRVERGALRIDSAVAGDAGHFMRLALPGDVIGVEQWVGTDDRLSFRALTEVSLTPVTASGSEMMQVLMETVVVAHQRCREVVSLRTGPVSQRVKTLLLMFADSVSPEATRGSDIALPNLSDMADILDAAPETVSGCSAACVSLIFCRTASHTGRALAAWHCARRR